ncbi:unnamed protein product, partial [Discosporangium mesarthrocarpum]
MDMEETSHRMELEERFNMDLEEAFIPDRLTTPLAPSCLRRIRLIISPSTGCFPRDNPNCSAIWVLIPGNLRFVGDLTHHLASEVLSRRNKVAVPLQLLLEGFVLLPVERLDILREQDVLTLQGEGINFYDKCEGKGNGNSTGNGKCESENDAKHSKTNGKGKIKTVVTDDRLRESKAAKNPRLTKRAVSADIPSPLESQESRRKKRKKGTGREVGAVADRASRKRKAVAGVGVQVKGGEGHGRAPPGKRKAKGKSDIPKDVKEAGGDQEST